MNENNLGEKLQILRKQMKYSQKDFADFLGIPQPSLSAYENNRNSPTMEVLINIATKCNVSLDWLCGLTSSSYTISTLGDVSGILFQLMEAKEIGLEFEIHDKLLNDTETDTDKWYTRVTVYGNDKKYPYNADLCNIIRKANETYSDLTTYAISKEMYDREKESERNYYTLPLTQKQLPDLSREERMKKHMEYLNSLAEK